MKQLPVIAIALIIGLALINNEHFGLATLSASLYYVIATCLFSLFFLITTAPGKQYWISPPHILAFNLLCLYIAGHGLFSGTFGMAHYYWLANGFLFNVIHIFRNGAGNQDSKVVPLLGNGILVIALLESLIIIAQSLGIIRSRNTLFTATGTWVNPNVTATFLALGFYFVLRAGMLAGKKALRIASLACILLAILILQSRTAYLVTLLSFCWHYRQTAGRWIHQRWPRVSHLVFPLTAAIILLAVVLSLQWKKGSTEGRLLVLQNSLQVIRDAPVTGAGFGLFEKKYNLFVAQHALPSQGQVSMAYNDFLELAIEGGIIAFLLWVGFLTLAYLYFRKKRYDPFPILAMVVIQVTNFGFQAVPVMALLLLYLAYPVPIEATKDTPAGTPGGSVGKRLLPASLRIGMAIVALLVLVHQFRIAIAYKRLHAIPAAANAIDDLEDIKKELQGHAYFHEKFGDAYLKKNDHLRAGGEYRQALNHNSYPALLVKYGYTFQRRNQYDSSLYYYQLAKNLEPFKFATRIVILRMYEQKKDTANMLLTAREILALPVKVENENATQIQRYAHQMLTTLK